MTTAPRRPGEPVQAAGRGPAPDDAVARVTGRLTAQVATRVPVAVAAGGAAAAAALVAAAAELSTAALVTVAVVLQALLAAAWLRLGGAPRAGRALTVVALSSVVGDVLLAERGHGRLGPLAGTLALSEAAVFVAVLLDAGRTRVADVVGAATGALLLSASVAPLVALRGVAGAPGGPRAVVVVALAMAAVGGTRVLDLVLPRPVLAGGRGAVGLSVGVVLAAALGAGVLPRHGLVLGLLCGVGAVTADGALAALAAGRRVALGLALAAPAVGAAPVGFLVGRIVLG